MVEFRDYQSDIIGKGCGIIEAHGFLYLAMEVRTGKTLTALGIASARMASNVLFVTKKKAIPSIEADYALLGPDYKITVINYESLHKVDRSGVDFLIVDEAHSMGRFPKPSNRAKAVKEILDECECTVILLSGTPTPESYSQMYHQVYAIPGNPFSEYKNFYRFFDVYGTRYQRKINGINLNMYDRGSESIITDMEPYTISFTQKQAGFEGEIEEEFMYVPLSDYQKKLIKFLKRDRVIEGKEEVILADTGAKLMSKIHQICSGTVKFESGNSKVLDTTKAERIKWKFDGQKIGIFYKFQAELEALKQVFGDGLTTSVEEFDSTDKSIALQIVSGREGVSLRNAEYLVFYNIDFSATSYWQARDRMTTKDRTYNKVIWVFSSEGIERDVYKTVSGKKNYTLRHFRKSTGC